MSETGEASREMTLDEWCERLPEIHRVRRELAALKTENAALRERVEMATIKALDYAASVCRGREKSNFESGQVTAANEAGKCAMAIEYHARNLKLTSLAKGGGMSELESLRQQALAIGVELAIALYGETPHPAQRGRYDREVAEATAIIDAFEAAAKREATVGWVTHATMVSQINAGCAAVAEQVREGLRVAVLARLSGTVKRLRCTFGAHSTEWGDGVDDGLLEAAGVIAEAPLPTPPDALAAVKREAVREWIEGLPPDSAVGIAQFIDKATPRPATLGECGALMQQALLNALAKEGENA